MTTPLLNLDDHIVLTSRDGQVLSARRLTRGDADALRAFNDALSPETGRRYLPHAYDPETLARLLARSETGDDLVMGLFDADAIVGYFLLWYFRERVPLLGIGLRDAYQHRGLGPQMLRLLVDQARSAGCEAVELTTLPDNRDAFAVYQTFGFRYIGDVENRSGDGRMLIERAMLYEILPGARPMDRPHGAPL